MESRNIHSKQKIRLGQAMSTQQMPPRDINQGKIQTAGHSESSI